MKFLRLFCLLLLCATAFAQPKKTKIIRTLHVLDSVRGLDITSHYDKKGMLSEEITNKRTFGGSNEVLYRDAYTYERGKTTRVQHFCNDSLISEELSLYKGNDLLHYQELVKGSVKLDEAYTYDKNRLTKVVTQSVKGNVTKEIKYIDPERLKETTITQNGKVTGIEKEYNNVFESTLEHYSLPEDGTTPSVKIEYVYDDYNNIIDMRTFTRGRETARQVSRYDNGVLSYRKDFVNGTVVAETYYDRGQLLKEQKQANNETVIYDSKYNKNGDILHTIVLKNGKKAGTVSYDMEYWE